MIGVVVFNEYTATADTFLFSVESERYLLVSSESTRVVDVQDGQAVLENTQRVALDPDLSAQEHDAFLLTPVEVCAYVDPDNGSIWRVLVARTEPREPWSPDPSSSHLQVVGWSGWDPIGERA